MLFCSAHRTPRARIDPIRDRATALRVLRLAIERPHVAETVALVLDPERRGIAIVVITGTSRGDDVLEVMECLSRNAADPEHAGGIVLASVRPGGGLEPADVDRWLEMSDECELVGLELVEWFVVGDDSVSCPRDLLGEPPRW